ncbi:hypothetical protein ANCDUO_09053 [Ancylostoma duodenale]|uniref:Uncharacterized protein n=1 Tax=Ancylostoma duodenale TaxID=51022 RepID=A0A0C2GHL5_9BILA|nr:hypothetical protein ANCDUO_09053 [Ancylostoma duodenale]
MQGGQIVAALDEEALSLPKLAMMTIFIFNASTRTSKATIEDLMMEAFDAREQKDQVRRHRTGQDEKV